MVSRGAWAPRSSVRIWPPRQKQGKPCFFCYKTMYYVYIIFSNSTNKFYTGSTENIESRLAHHNGAYNRSTKQVEFQTKSGQKLFNILLNFLSYSYLFFGILI